MLKRARSTITAKGRLGISGTISSKTFDGKWVTTIVRINPKRAASREASRAETPDRIFAQKKITPSIPGFTPKRK